MDLKSWLNFHGSIGIEREWTYVPECQRDVEGFGRSRRWFVWYVLLFTRSRGCIVVLGSGMLGRAIIESIYLASDDD